MSSFLQQCHKCRQRRPTSCSTCDDYGDGFFDDYYGFEDGNHITFHIRLALSLSTATSQSCHADNSTLLDLKLQSAHHDTGSNNNRGEVPSSISYCITYIINKIYNEARCNRHSYDPYDCKLDFEYLMTLIRTYAPGLREAHLVYDVLSTADVNLMTRMIRRDLRNSEMSNSIYQLVLSQRGRVRNVNNDDVIDFVLRVKTNNGDHRVSTHLNQAKDDENITSPMPMENAKTDDDTEQRSTDDRDVSAKCKTTETAKDPSSSSSTRYRNGIPPALATAWEESTKEYKRDSEQEKVAVELTESDNIDDEKTGTLPGDTTKSLLIAEDDSSSKDEKDKKNELETKTKISSVDEVVGDGPTKGAPKRKVEIEEDGADETSSPEKMAKNAQKRVKIDDESSSRSSCNDAKDKKYSGLEVKMSQDVPPECAVKDANNFSFEIMSIANATSSSLISDPKQVKKRGNKRSQLNAALEEHDRMIIEETKENESLEKKSESISGGDNSDSSSSSSSGSSSTSSSGSDSDSGSSSSSSDSDCSEDEKEDDGDQNVKSLYSSKTEILLEKHDEEVGKSDPVGDASELYKLAEEPSASSQHSAKSSFGSSSSDSNSSSDSSSSSDSDSDSESSGEDSRGDGVQDGEKEKIIYNVEATSIGGELNERMDGAGVDGAVKKNSTSTRRDNSNSSGSSSSSSSSSDGDSSSSSSNSDSDSSDEEEEKERKLDQRKVGVDDKVISARAEESNNVGEEDSTGSNKLIEENVESAGASSQQSHQSSSESSHSNSSSDSSSSSESETSGEGSSDEEEQEEQQVSSVNEANSSSDVSSSALNLSQFSELFPTNLFENSDTQQAPHDENNRGSESSSSSSSDSSSNASSEEQSQDLLQFTDVEEQKSNQRKEIVKSDEVEEETIELPKTSGGESNSNSSSSDSSSSGSSSTGSDSSDDDDGSDDEEDEMGCATDIIQLNTSQNDKIAHPLKKDDGEDEIPGTQNSNFPANRGHFPSTSTILPNKNEFSSTASDSESSSSSDSSDSDSSSSSGSDSSSSSSSSDNEGEDDAGRKDDKGASTPELASDAAAASVTSNKRRRRTPLVPMSRKIVVSTIEGSQIQSFRRA